MQDCDLLVTNALLVDAIEQVHAHDAMAVVGNRIVEVGRTQDLAGVGGGGCGRAVGGSSPATVG